MSRPSLPLAGRAPGGGGARILIAGLIYRLPSVPTRVPFVADWQYGWQSGRQRATVLRQADEEGTARAGWSLRNSRSAGRRRRLTSSRVENGKRPADRGMAKACDTAFPERQGWFVEYYAEISKGRGARRVP